MSKDFTKMSPKELRAAFARGEWTEPTVGMGLGYLQCNLAIVPKEDALDLLLLCMRNPAPCPILEVTEPGSPFLTKIAKGADIRKELPKYRIYKRGELVEELTDITDYWRDDFVAFLIGCSLTFENALLKSNVPLRHLEGDAKIPVYISNIELNPAGKFHGKMVVSMRPIPGDLVSRAVLVTSRFPAGHGAPVHIGNPEAIGIADINKVDFGAPPVMKPGDVPVFWGCGITPQAVAMASKPEIMITHAPECMLVSDLTEDEVSIF